MAGEIFRIGLALVLAASALAKLAAPGSTRAALGTFGIHGARIRWAGWSFLVIAEAGLAAGVVAGLDLAAYLGAGLMAIFALALAVALARGRGGAPCACFGSRSTVGPRAVVRAVVLAAAFAAVPAVGGGHLSTEQWLGLGLGVALLACAGLGVAVLALAREVGMLRLRLGPDSALEIPDEGPEIGVRSPVIDRFGHPQAPEQQLALAVFVSAGCRACRALEPAVESLAGDPMLAVEIFEEGTQPGAWSEADVPGSPYAVAMDPSGIVLAKGTFNNLAQLESVLATAERRRFAFDSIGAAGG